MRLRHLFIALITGYIPVHAQTLSPEVIAVAGQDDHSSRIQLSWTLGELATEGVTGEIKSYTEGFHQPTLIVEPVDQAITSIDETEAQLPLIHLTVAPNPVASTLSLHIDPSTEHALNVIMTNLTGAVVWHDFIYPMETKKSLDVARLPTGMYFLHIQTMEGKNYQSFKISKI